MNNFSCILHMRRKLPIKIFHSRAVSGKTVANTYTPSLSVFLKEAIITKVALFGVTGTGLLGNPLFWSMACSSFFVVILSKRDFFLESSFVFDSFQFFVPYLSAAPTWGMSVVAKLCCVLSSFLVAVYYSRISFHSINSLFLEHRSLVFHLLSQRSYLGFCLFFIVQKVRRDLERHDPLIL